ncbi:hypothetical protein E2C01_102292 [Portunus trituberculatus]|uniref:Uncharacterized protein n=1 Tax=Portunus trituberculatus TaxID=210409 RepID=A0A5B7KM86_PORTR|nr:hypothetical protein [Portunus trituberculatus]
MPLSSAQRYVKVALVKCSSQILRSMHFFVVFSMVAAMAQATSVPPTAEKNSCSGLKDDRSILSTLLTVTGYSDTCVTAVLDFCSTGQEDSRYVSLMETKSFLFIKECLHQCLFDRG